MKIKDECAHCGYRARKVTITIEPEHRDLFIAFTEKMQQAGVQGIIPPSKYPRHSILIPTPGENPCSHCQYGEEMAGPSGCGRGNTCFAYKYFQMAKLSDNTASPDTLATLKEFTCGVPTATWILPTTKKAAAKSAAVHIPTPPQTSSPAKTESSKKSAKRRSQWRGASNLHSTSRSKPSSKRRRA